MGLKSFFSRVNNVHECTFLSDNYFSDCYGYTENELNKILSHFSINSTNEVRKKYNGYSCVSSNGIIKKFV